MNNPFRVRCHLCEEESDISDMRKLDGRYYHTKKVKNFSSSCLQAVKDSRKKS